MAVMADSHLRQLNRVEFVGVVGVNWPLIVEHASNTHELVAGDRRVTPIRHHFLSFV